MRLARTSRHAPLALLRGLFLLAGLVYAASAVYGHLWRYPARGHGLVLLLAELLLVSVIGPTAVWVLTRRVEALLDDADARYAALARAHQTTATLREVALELAGTRDFDALLALIARRAAELLEADSATLYLLDPAGQTLVPRAWHPRGDRIARSLRLGEGVAGLVARDGRALIVNDSPRWPADLAAEEGWQAAVGVPLVVRAQLLGSLVVHTRRPQRRFAEADAGLLGLLAAQAGVALETARLFRQTQGRLARTEALLAVTRHVASALDLTEALRRVAREAGRALDADCAGALLADQPNGVLRALAGWRTPREQVAVLRSVELPVVSPLVREAVAAGRPVVLPDLKADERLDPVIRGALPFASLLFAPMLVAERLTGAVVLFWSAARTSLTPEELGLVEGICRQAALAVEAARLLHEAEQQRRQAEAYAQEAERRRRQAEGALAEVARVHDALFRAQKLEALGRLAGGIAHDFNNLLTVILGRAYLLLARLRGDDPARRDLELIRTTAERAAALTRQLLAFSRRQALQPVVLDLNAVVGELVPMLRSLLGEDIQLQSRLAPSLGAVRADRAQLEQVILNLVVNARDAMPEGGVLTLETREVPADHPELRAEPDAAPGPHVALVVRDTGVGMDAATLARIFEPFFSTKPASQGTGLGLATVYGVVRQSGGVIRVWSAPGAGATFAVYLPRVDGKPARAEDLPSVPASGWETVLVAEDEADLRELVREVLEAAGYRVLAARTADEALRLTREHAGPIHLVLTDVVMPGMSGPALAREVQARRAEARVLFMSGHAGRSANPTEPLDPAAPRLEKPFTPDALVVAVREVLDGARA